MRSRSSRACVAMFAALSIVLLDLASAHAFELGAKWKFFGKLTAIRDNGKTYQVALETHGRTVLKHNLKLPRGKESSLKVFEKYLSKLTYLDPQYDSSYFDQRPGRWRVKTLDGFKGGGLLWSFALLPVMGHGSLEAAAFPIAVFGGLGSVLLGANIAGYVRAKRANRRELNEWLVAKANELHPDELPTLPENVRNAVNDLRAEKGKQ